MAQRASPLPARMAASPAPRTMGCTSSAPHINTPPEHSDKNVRIFEEMDEIADKVSTEKTSGNNRNGSNEIPAKVLPICDNLGDRLQLDSTVNNSSFIKTSELDKDSHVTEVLSSDDNSYAKLPLVDEKMSSLEDVVEKVVELYVADIALEVMKPAAQSELSEDVKNDSEEVSEIVNKDLNVDPIDIKEDPENSEHYHEELEREEEPTEAGLSPSQSESSRATRWEALADIAAELPASLTVDPLTGQIYALSK